MRGIFFFTAIVCSVTVSLHAKFLINLTNALEKTDKEGKQSYYDEYPVQIKPGDFVIVGMESWTKSYYFPGLGFTPPGGSPKRVARWFAATLHKTKEDKGNRHTLWYKFEAKRGGKYSFAALGHDKSHSIGPYRYWVAVLPKDKQAEKLFRGNLTPGSNPEDTYYIEVEAGKVYRVYHISEDFDTKLYIDLPGDRHYEVYGSGGRTGGKWDSYLAVCALQDGKMKIRASSRYPKEYSGAYRLKIIFDK